MQESKIPKVNHETFAFGLWLVPDFSAAMRDAPPYVDHNNVDWPRLKEELDTFFSASGYGINLRLANDTVDQVTIEFREKGRLDGTIECRDFGDILIQKAKSCSGDDVIDIQEEWNSLHFLKQRNNAPPPVMIPLIVEGHAANIVDFHYEMQLRLKVKNALPGNILSSMTGNNYPEDPSDMQGYLPQKMMDVFGELFNCPYKTYAVVTPITTKDLSSLLYQNLL